MAWLAQILFDEEEKKKLALLRTPNEGVLGGRIPLSDWHASRRSGPLLRCVVNSMLVSQERRKEPDCLFQPRLLRGPFLSTPPETCYSALEGAQRCITMGPLRVHLQLSARLHTVHKGRLEYDVAYEQLHVLESALESLNYQTTRANDDEHSAD